MARIIYSDEIKDPEKLSWNDGYWVYNALDCCVTREVIDIVEAQLIPEQRTVYEFSCGMMAPAFTMMTRGVRIDREVLDAVQRWANDDLRSLNGQIEFLLRHALREAGRAPSPRESIPPAPASDGAEDS